MIQQKIRMKTRPVLMFIFQYSQSKMTGLNKMWSLKTVAILKRESRTSQHAVQYKWQPGCVLMICSYYSKNG